jgi:hypothetical protein
MLNLTRSAVMAAGLAAGIGAALAGVLVTPAHAGGDNIHYVYGATASTCTSSLNSSIRLYRANDYVVTGIHGCRLTGDRQRYFGDFVANPR